ncbi:MAG: hypothetical protein EOO87_04270 [Pedobacter sp.]|nr:MAG: hypothetical protein EOO87_04270 [Pedobacter sp.]
MRSSFYTFLLTVAVSTVFAQSDNHNAELKKQQKKCEEISASFSGKPETLEALIKEGTIGLKIAKANDHEFKYGFNLSVGSGYYYKQDFKKAQFHFEQAYDEAVKAKLLEKSLKPLGHLVVLYHYVGLQAKADAAAQKLKSLAESTDTLKTKSNVYYNLGIYNQQQKSYYSIALSNFLKAVELQKPIADTTKVAKFKIDYGVMLLMVGEIYLQMKQPNKAIEYLNEAKPYLTLSKVINITAYGKFVRSYVLLNNKKEALKYYQLLHSTASDGPGNWSELVSSSIEMATLETRLGNFAEAKKYLDKADKQAKTDNKEILTSSVNLAYGEYYKATKNYPLSASYFKSAEKGSKIYNKEQYADLLKSLTAVEILTGSKTSAEAYFNKHVSLSDSLNQSKISLNLAEMEAKFQNEFKQRKITSLNKENDVKNLQLQQEKTVRWLLVGGAILLLSVLATILYSYRTKQKANLLLEQKNAQLDLLNEELEDANQTKSRLFSIISHDLRSPISQLFTFLKLQQTNPNTFTAENKAQHEQVLMESSKQLLATMEDLLLWSKSQLEHFELDIEEVEVLQLFNDSIGLIRNQAETKNVAIKIGELSLTSIKSDHNFLNIVLRNLLQNAVTHSFPQSAVFLNAGLTPNPYISIINTGDIISPEKINELLNNHHVKSKSSGYGLLIVKELLQKLNGTLSIESSHEQTIIMVEFK